MGSAEEREWLQRAAPSAPAPEAAAQRRPLDGRVGMRPLFPLPPFARWPARPFCDLVLTSVHWRQIQCPERKGNCGNYVAY